MYDVKSTRTHVHKTCITQPGETHQSNIPVRSNKYTHTCIPHVVCCDGTTSLYDVVYVSLIMSESAVNLHITRQVVCLILTRPSDTKFKT